MEDKKKMTTLNPSVGADEEQSLSKNCNDSITETQEQCNSFNEIKTKNCYIGMQLYLILIRIKHDDVCQP